MSITNLLRLVFDRWKIWNLFTISGLVYIRFSHFHHYGILKNSTIDLPISILLDSLHPELNRALLHRVFGFVYISSHICSHIWKLKNNLITKLFHKAFRKCIQLLYSDQVQSHKQALKICWTQKRSTFGPKRAQNGRANFLRTVNLNFLKEDHKNIVYTKNHENTINRLEDIS